MTTPHAFVSIKGVATCFDCGSGRDSDLHEGFEAKDNDLIGSLVASVRAAGLTLTYNGRPISEEHLREVGEAAATETLAVIATEFSLGYDKEADQTLFCTTALPVDESDGKGWDNIVSIATHAKKLRSSGLMAITIVGGGG